MADETTVREVVGRFFEFAGADIERAEELYHPEAVLEFPQTGERFDGRDTFTAWRRQHPVDLADLRFQVNRVTAREDFSVTELSGSYDGGQTWQCGVQLLDFRDDKVIRERIYVVPREEPPEWRAPWRSAEPAV